MKIEDLKELSLNLIKKNELQEALDLLDLNIKGRDRIDIIQLYSRYSKLIKETNQGMVSIEDRDLLENKIRKSLIVLVNNLTSNKNAHNETQIDQKKSKDFRAVFTPGAPPIISSLLVGRSEELSKLENYLVSPGIHPVVLGHRGIGKTSLIKNVIDNLPEGSSFTFEANLFNNFSELAKAIVIRFDLTSELAKHDVKIITPFILRVILEELKRKVFIHIDELDAISKQNDIRSCLPNLIKSIASDPINFKHKFIFSGIGRSVDTLFDEHESVTRNIPGIYLNKINEDSFKLFFVEAENILEIKIPRSIKSEISTDANGFPYYVHLVSLHMMEEFDKSEENGDINYEHYLNGKEAAAEQAFSYHLKQYKFSIYKLTKVEKNILSIILKKKTTYLALDEVMNIACVGFNTEKELVQNAINKLIKEKYISYRRADNKIYLANPLLRQFLKIKLKISSKNRKRRKNDDNDGEQLSLIHC